MARLISLIISVYNEQEALGRFYDTARGILEEFCGASSRAYDYELCFVNDGSSDSSGQLLKALKTDDPRHVSVISFSRNFGHEAAMTAGLDMASGELLIFMDADLQHPPELIPQIIAAYEEGYEIISMVRTSNESAGGIKNLTSGLFYRIINIISDASLLPGASDFFAIGSRAAEVLRSNYREKIRFLRGYVQNIGFNKTFIEYEAARRVAGQSHYSLGKLLRFSIDTIVCFSDMPLRLGIYAGLISGMLGIILIIYTLCTREGAPGGYTTIVILLCFMFAVLFMLLGVIGGYLAIVFREIQDRPIYIIKNAELIRRGDNE